MHITRKFHLILGGAILGMALIACSCGSILPMLTGTVTPAAAPLPTNPPAPTLPQPPADQPSDLAGYWQIGEVVFTIESQAGKPVVTAINMAGTSTRILENQSWDGASLTWTYTYTDENGSSTVTYKTVSVNGDFLRVEYSTSGGGSRVRLLRKVNSRTPDYYSLPWSEDFSNPESGWDIYSTTEDQAGYQDGAYFVISKTNKFSSFGSSNRFFGNTVIDVDATPVSGPDPNDYSYHVGCRVQSNADGYIFEVEADGYYAAGYYKGGGNDYVSLLTGDDWQPSSAIKQGLQANHLTVTCSGNQLKLAINGQVVYSGQDSTFTEGDIDLGAATYDKNNQPAEIHFTDLEVKLP